MDVINIEKHIRRWAKLNHKIEVGEKTGVEIVYDRVKLNVVNQKNCDVSDVDIDSQATDSSSEQTLVVFESHYKNSTLVPQQHEFTMSKETSATFTSSMTKGFTRSEHVGITLAVPDTLTNVTGGFGPEVLIRHADDSTIHHKLQWKVNSTVNVPSQQTTEAKLIIKETEKKFQYTADVILRGTVLVRHFDLTTGEMISIVQSKIATLLEDIRDKQNGQAFEGNKWFDDLPKIPDYVKFEDGRVIWPVEGTMHFKFGINQDVVVQPKSV